jgi:hypothetical protein
MSGPFRKAVGKHIILIANPTRSADPGEVPAPLLFCMARKMTTVHYSGDLERRRFSTEKNVLPTAQSNTDDDFRDCLIT